MKGKAIGGFVLGLISLVAWFVPLFGIPVSIVGLCLGIGGSKGYEAKGLAVAGIVLSIIGLVLSIVNASIGAYMGASGQLF